MKIYILFIEVGCIEHCYFNVFNILGDGDYCARSNFPLNVNTKSGLPLENESFMEHWDWFRWKPAAQILSLMAKSDLYLVGKRLTPWCMRMKGFQCTEKFNAFCSRKLPENVLWLQINWGFWELHLFFWINIFKK